MTTLAPYLFLDGRTEEALKFYAEALRGQVKAMIRLGEAVPNTPEAQKQHVIHSLFEAGEVRFMASDGMPGSPPEPSGRISMALGFDSTEEQERVFQALSAGGTVITALHDTFYGGRMGVLTDKYGIRWMLNWSPPEQK